MPRHPEFPTPWRVHQGAIQAADGTYPLPPSATHDDMPRAMLMRLLRRIVAAVNGERVTQNGATDR